MHRYYFHYTLPSHHAWIKIVHCWTEIHINCTIHLLPIVFEKNRPLRDRNTYYLYYIYPFFLSCLRKIVQCRTVFQLIHFFQIFWKTISHIKKIYVNSKYVFLWVIHCFHHKKQIRANFHYEFCSHRLKIRRYTHFGKIGGNCFLEI